MTIGERIKQRRLELSYTQQELADKLGYKDRSAVCQVEGDKNNSITIDRVQAFANALEVSPGYLMGWENEPKPESPISFDFPWDNYTEEEQDIIRAYRNADEIDRRSVLRILGLENKEKEGALGA